MPGEVFPTADHPPKNILMGGEARGSPGMTRDGYFPRSQHPGTPDQSGKPPDQPRGPLPKRDGSWESPYGGVKPPKDPGGGFYPAIAKFHPWP